MKSKLPPPTSTWLNSKSDSSESPNNKLNGPVALGPHEIGQYASFESRKKSIASAKETFSNLIKFADAEYEFAEHLCKVVIDRYGPDDRLSAMMMKRLRAERTGKEAVRRKKWNYARYRGLLDCYNLSIAQGQKRLDVLEKLAVIEGYSGKNATKKIEEKITEAKALIKD
ncbi:MAG: hypothetical protein N0E44_19015 [Candidatus Thiodiazotropha lotti]|nr:hypothetical protein [Candidatus Thiodiazotropha lotti]MCW4221977.1 hypothetical protein [Candidatus Thiodiazotropha lotti]